jgi:outer membrane murein-binding lipoprotein Lpp
MVKEKRICQQQLYDTVKLLNSQRAVLSGKKAVIKQFLEHIDEEVTIFREYVRRRRALLTSELSKHEEVSLELKSKEFAIHLKMKRMNNQIESLKRKLNHVEEMNIPAITFEEVVIPDLVDPEVDSTQYKAEMYDKLDYAHPTEPGFRKKLLKILDRTSTDTLHLRSSIKEVNDFTLGLESELKRLDKISSDKRLKLEEVNAKVDDLKSDVERIRHDVTKKKSKIKRVVKGIKRRLSTRNNSSN